MGSEPPPGDKPPVRRRRGDEEWEQLARQVQAEIEEEEDDEDVGDDSTELYDELDLEEEGGLEPLIPDTASRFHAFVDPPTEEELVLDPATEEVGLIDLDEPEGNWQEQAGELTPAQAPELPVLPWRGLHPASVVVNLIPRTWRVLVGFWPLLLAIALGVGTADGFSADSLLWILLFIGSGAFSTIVHFMTLRYRIHEGRLEIKQGLLNRQARTIDPARIQNVGLVRNVFHRWAGLVEVRVETAGGVRTEGLLSALAEDDARQLMAALDTLRGRARPAEGQADQTTPLLALGFGELIAYGLSRGRVGLVAGLFWVGWEVMILLSPEQTELALDKTSPVVLGGLVLLALAASWGASGLMSLMRHYGFSLFLDEDEGRLRSQEGLFTERKVEIPVRKVQLVGTDEPWIRRLMGFGTVSVETAGLGSVREGVAAAELVVPMVDRDELIRIVRAAIPEATVDPWRDKLAPAHPRALYRMIVAGLVKWTLLGGVVAVVLWTQHGPGLAWLGLALPIVSIPANILDWRYQGWLVTGDVVVARRGFWRRRTWILARDKLQSVHLVQGPLMRLHGLGRLAVRVAGSQVVLPDIGFSVAESLLDELRPTPELMLD
jgi:putative membrane protein